MPYGLAAVSSRSRHMFNTVFNAWSSFAVGLWGVVTARAPSRGEFTSGQHKEGSTLSTIACSFQAMRAAARCRCPGRRTRMPGPVSRAISQRALEQVLELVRPGAPPARRRRTGPDRRTDPAHHGRSCGRRHSRRGRGFVIGWRDGGNPRAHLSRFVQRGRLPLRPGAWQRHQQRRRNPGHARRPRLSCNTRATSSCSDLVRS